MNDGLDRLWPALLAHAHEAGPAPALDRLEPAERALARLYLDFLAPRPDGLAVLAHLGMSLCGHIATASGHSTYVTGEANLVHMHRLRALADAVLVGAGTVAADDPQLTVRLVDGPSPLRVVVDTERRLATDHRLFISAPPPTLVLCRRERAREPAPGAAEVVGLTSVAGRLEPRAILAELRRRGVRRLFVEGGGVTVSRFLAAGCLDRLQLCVAPVVIGSGRPALRLPEITRMAEALRLAPLTLPMGCDTLFAAELTRRPLETGLARQPQEIVMADAG